MTASLTFVKRAANCGNLRPDLIIKNGSNGFLQKFPRKKFKQFN